MAPDTPKVFTGGERKRARLLHVISGLKRGGAELGLLRLASSAEMNGFAHSVLGIHGKAELAPDFCELGIPVETLGLDRIGQIAARSPRIVAALPTLRRCNLLNGIMYHGSLLATLGALCGRKIPLVWNIRHSLDNWSEEKAATRGLISLLGRLSRHADSIVYNSDRSRNQHTDIGYAAENAVLIHNGVDTERFRPDAARRSEFRRALGLPYDALLIGHVARLDPIKAHAVALAAAERVAARDKRARFVFVGVENASAVALAFLASSAYRDRFFFLGERTDIHAIMPALDLFWLSSLSESHPNVVLEAMSSGVPCVSTEVGDVRDFLGAERWIVPINDAEALASAALAALALPQADRAALGHAARVTAVERFSLHRMCSRYAQVFDEALRRAGAARGTTRVGDARLE